MDPGAVSRVGRKLDYEQALFFLGPSSKTRETRKWPRAWLKAQDALLVVLRLRHSTLPCVRALPSLNLKKRETARRLGKKAPCEEQVLSSEFQHPIRFRGIVWVLVKRGVEAGDGAVMGVYLFLGMLCFRVRIRVRLGLFRVIED